MTSTLLRKKTASRQRARRLGGSVACLAVLLTVSGGPVWSSPPRQSLDEILTRVRTNVRNNAVSTEWNIVCNLRESSHSSNRQVMGPPHWIVESIVGGRGTDLEPGTIRWFREVLSFQGNPPGSPGPSDPVPAPNPVVGNVFLRPWYDYKQTGTEGIGGSPTLIIQYQSNKQFPLRGGYSRDFGRAWIDTVSLQPIRIEDHLVNGSTDPVTTVNFEKMAIAGKNLWISTKVTTDSKTTVKDRMGHVVTEYSNCRKYDASVEIKPIP